MENSDAPGVRGEPGGHRASGRGRDSPDAHFCFADILRCLSHFKFANDEEWMETFRDVGRQEEELLERRKLS